MKTQILGSGCQKCTQLAASTEDSAKELGIDYELEKITDINEIIELGVMMTPALVIDGKVKSSGKALSSEEIKEILTHHQTTK